MMTDKELDFRIRNIPPTHNVRSFSKGISHLSQVTGTERKNIASVLLACLIGSKQISRRALIAAQALLDFVYIAQYPMHDDSSLGKLDRFKGDPVDPSLTQT
jgi:hypothetical protein